MRLTPWLVAATLVLTAGGRGAARAEEPVPAPVPAPQGEATRQAVEVAVGADIVAFAPGPTAGEWIVARRSGVIERLVPGRAATWRAEVDGPLEPRQPAWAGLGEPLSIDVTYAAPGAHVLVTTVRELLVLGAEGKVLWRTPRPAGLAVEAKGTHVRLVRHDGTIARLALADGAASAEVRAATRRTIERAVVHPGAGLAVIGVNDG